MNTDDPSTAPVVDPLVSRPAITPTGRVQWWTAGVALALAGLLSLSAYAGRMVLVAAVLLAVVVLAWGWAELLDLPSPRGTTALVALGGALAAVAVGLTTSEPLLQWLALALAASVIGEFVHQLARRDSRPRMVESVSGSVAGVVVLASLAAIVALPQSPVGAGGVLVWAMPVGVALCLQVLSLPARITLPLGVLVAVLSGALLGGLLGGPTLVSGAVAAGVATVVSLMLHRLLAVLPPAGSAPGWLALATAPLAASGMVAYVILRLLGR